jgi:hypothetical protein
VGVAQTLRAVLKATPTKAPVPVVIILALRR